MTGGDLIEKWIQKQVDAGKGLHELSGTQFIYNSSIYKISRPNKRGQFHLDVYCGAINLEEWLVDTFVKPEGEANNP